MTTTDFFIPRSVDEAVGLLRDHGPGLTVMGGGTIVMGLINDGRLFPRKAMSLRRAGMDELRAADGQIQIGAAATMARLSRLEELPILAQAAGMLGGPAVRTLATIGGNMFAPPPYADIAVPLLALDAQIELAGPRGRRALPLDQFFTGLGQTACAADELLAGFSVPRSDGQSAYLRFGRRQANTPSVVAVAARVVTGADGTISEARIALGAAGPYPLRARTAEAALVGRPLDAASIADAAAAAMAESDPPTDALASGWYRRKMVGVFVRRALENLKG
ncbi:MAG: FAD binding domain-containing protein [Roseiflexaceae bacterium]